jgi:hemerythrin-like domain-containing protein
MLTATYTLVALSVEQASIRISLQSLQTLLQRNFRCQTVLGAAQVAYASDLLHRLYHNVHWRKVDMFLIPAVQRVTRQADTLLAEFDALSNQAGEAIAKVAARVGAASVDSEAAVTQFCEQIDNFCSAILERLDREEQELFAIARGVISGEAWFSIANHMLAHDAERDENRPPRGPLPPAAARLPQRTSRHGQAAAFVA